MMKLKIAAEERKETGKNVAGKIRREDMVPAVIYGRAEETVHVKVNEPEFRKVQRQAGAATILGLSLGSDEVPVIIKEVQKDPVKDEILHVDFQKINMDEKLRVILPIVLINREDIKTQPSILTQQLDEIEIESLPKDLPGDIEVDVADMQIGDTISLGDLEIAKNEGITLLRDLDDVICALSEFVEEDLDALEDEELDLDAEPELVSDEDDEDELLDEAEEADGE